MMDKKKAADLLDNLIGMVEDSHGADYDTALRMGIEALSAQPERITLTEEERRTLKKMRTLYNGSYAKLLDKLFVSAQPDHSGDVNGKVDLIERQAAIDAFNICVTIGRGNGKTVAFEAVNDYANTVIKRITALPSAQPEVTEEAVKEYCRKRCLCIVDSALLKKYASAQPERKTGKWIDCNWSVRCSECDYSMPWDVRNFCPNCGADMRGE